MHDVTLFQCVLGISLGVVAQVIARQLVIPSIVLLLLIGVLCGPDGLRWLSPDDLGAVLPALVALSVTVILFEGGLGLRWRDLQAQQRSLVRLLTLGALITMIGSLLAARLLLGVPWGIAVLYGTLMTVTGPTVVTPLLRGLRLDRNVRELLISEGVLIDPIGAVLALVAAECVIGRVGLWEAPLHISTQLGVGAAVGGIGGLLLAPMLKRQWIPDVVRNPAVLAGALLVAAIASVRSSEGGLTAAVALGAVLANSGIGELGRLREFKEEITLLLLSFIFVMLAAALPLTEVWNLGWRGLAVVFVVMWVVRPVAVLLCTAGSELTWAQRLFVSWICPRGIVAASVAGLFAVLLDDAGIAGGQALEALVFVTIGVTVAVQGLTARRVAHLLGVDVPTVHSTLILGADEFGRLLAKLLATAKRPVVLIDLNPEHCRLAREEGLAVYQGNALSGEALVDAGIEYADAFVAVTRNRELNALMAQRVKRDYSVERIIAVDPYPDPKHAGGAFPGNFPGLDSVNEHLRTGLARVVIYEVEDDEDGEKRVSSFDWAVEEFAMLVQQRERLYLATAEDRVGGGDRLICLRLAATAAIPPDGLVVTQQVPIAEAVKLIAPQ